MIDMKCIEELYEESEEMLYKQQRMHPHDAESGN